MSRTRKRFPLLSIALAAGLAMPVLAANGQTAHADVTVRVRGNVRVKVRPQRVQRVRVRHRHRTVRPRVRLHVGSGIYWGGGVYVGRFSQPPPPPVPAYDCHQQRVQTYYVPAPAPGPVVAAAPAVQAYAPPPLPRFGIGLFAGGSTINGQPEGQDLGVFGRLRLTDSLYVEAELAKTELIGDMKGARVDRRFGGALLWDIAPRSSWTIHLLAGGGVTQVAMDRDTWQSNEEYGEVGAALTWRLSRRFHLSGDLRAGVRAPVEGGPSDPALKSLAPSSVEGEQFTRGRLSAILYF